MFRAVMYLWKILHDKWIHCRISSPYTCNQRDHLTSTCLCINQGFFFNILEQIVTTQSDIPDQASYVMEVKVYDDCRLTQTGTVTLTVPNTVNYTIIRRTQNILDSWKNKTLQPAQSLSRILVHQKTSLSKLKPFKENVLSIIVYLQDRIKYTHCLNLNC